MLLGRVGDARTIGTVSPDSFRAGSSSSYVQIIVILCKSLKLAKDFTNQIAVPVSLNKALLIKVLVPVKLPRPLWELYMNIVIVLQNV